MGKQNKSISKKIVCGLLILLVLQYHNIILLVISFFVVHYFYHAFFESILADTDPFSTYLWFPPQ